MSTVAFIDASTVEYLVKDIARFYFSSAAGVDVAVVERTETNESDEALQPVLPYQMAAI